MFVTCHLQQALREVSRIESDVDTIVEKSEDEMEQNADVCDMPESIATEPTKDTPDDEMCSKYDAPANRVIKLQKKISWLKKSKQKLKDSLNMV